MRYSYLTVHACKFKINGLQNFVTSAHVKGRNLFEAWTCTLGTANKHGSGKCNFTFGCFTDESPSSLYTTSISPLAALLTRAPLHYTQPASRDWTEAWTWWQRTMTRTVATQRDKNCGNTASWQQLTHALALSLSLSVKNPDWKNTFTISSSHTHTLTPGRTQVNK
jgi:hypothetical protein